MAGIAAGLYDPERVYDCIEYTDFHPGMEEKEREQRISGWKAAVKQVLTRSNMKIGS